MVPFAVVFQETSISGVTDVRIHQATVQVIVQVIVLHIKVYCRA